MTVLTPPPLLATQIRIDAAARRSVERITYAAGVGVARARDAVARARVTNEVAPLILIVVIAVVAALALIAVIGAAAAWLYYCRTTYGGRSFPAGRFPTANNGTFGFGCSKP